MNEMNYDPKGDMERAMYDSRLRGERERKKFRDLLLRVCEVLEFGTTIDRSLMIEEIHEELRKKK